MRLSLMLVIFFCYGTSAVGQKYSVIGQLTDTLGAPLHAATVLLLNAGDSSLVTFTSTDAEGRFGLRNVSKAPYLIKVTFVGFKPYTAVISPGEDNYLVDLGSIRLAPAATELDAIEIAADRAPVKIRRDTIEYNAGSFKTQENAVVEDLLKKLPGVEVDQDGNIIAQGEQVRNVTVDGKNFFGRDPKIATRNLPADAVDKVQVFDKKSDQALFSGIDDGQREKTINLELKEEKRKGAFGNLLAGAGSEERFQARASINKFTKQRQLSLLAMGNNTNEQGFSMEEYMNFSGTSRQMMGGGAFRLEMSDNGIPLNFGNRANGLMTNYAAGINMNNEFNARTEANGSYFFNYLDHDRTDDLLRRNFLPGGSFTFRDRSSQRNSNVNHRLTSVVDHKLDSMNSLKLTTNLTMNETEMNVRSASSNELADGTVRNSGTRDSRSTGSSLGLNSTLLLRHKFPKKGRTVSANLTLGVRNADRFGTLSAHNTFVAETDSIATLHQRNAQTTGALSHAQTISYTEPLGRRRYLEANYSFRQAVNEVDREVFDLNGSEEVVNTTLSNQYKSDYRYHRAGLNFRIAKRDYNFLVGGSFQETSLRGVLSQADEQLQKNFGNFLPSLRFNYDFSQSRHLRFEYDTNVEEPSIQQLQPVIDNSDPLNVYQGNPGLRPAYVQSLRLNFTTFDPATFISFFTFVDVDHVRNAIVTAQSVSSELVRVSQPVNVSGLARLNSSSSFGFPISKINSRFNIGADYRAERSVSVLNDRENGIFQQTLGGSIQYSFRYKEIVDLSLSADIDRQITGYEFGQPDQHFMNQTFTGDANFSFLKSFRFSAGLDYLVYTSKSTGFRQQIPLVDLSLSRTVFKNRSGEVKLSVVNLLDRALGVSQVASINYLERQTTNSLGRYVMLSFNYALNKQLNPMGMRRGGAMMRVIR